MATGAAGALREARALLAECEGRVAGSPQSTLALLVRAMAHLADAIADTPGAAGAGENAGTVGADMPSGGPQFDRSRPARGYNRGE